MLWFIQVSVVSLIIIFVLHNLYLFFKDTLTVPKVKDLVKRPQQKYETLFRELRDQIAEQPTSNADDMKNELKRYLMDLNSSQKSQQPQTLQPQPQFPQPQSDFIELGAIYQ